VAAVGALSRCQHRRGDRGSYCEQRLMKGERHDGVCGGAEVAAGRATVWIRVCNGSSAAAQGRCAGTAFAWKEQPRTESARSRETEHLARSVGAGAPLARQRGGKPRWRDTPAESSGARARRRGCGREGVDARGPRRGRVRPAQQGRCSGGWRRTRPQTELAESEERDPPTGPARRQLLARRRALRARHLAGVAGAEVLVRNDEGSIDLCASTRRAAVTSAAVARSTRKGSIGVR
jgi:hypothetical protein